MREQYFFAQKLIAHNKYSFYEKSRTIALHYSREDSVSFAKRKLGGNLLTNKNIDFDVFLEISKKQLTENIVNWGELMSLSGKCKNMKAYKINGFYFCKKHIDIIKAKELKIFGFFDIGYGDRGCMMVLSDKDETCFMFHTSLYFNTNE